MTPCRLALAATVLLAAPLALAGPAGAAGQQAAAVTCQGRAATIVGTAGNDRVLGTPGADVIALLGGNDAVDGLGGNDLICGGPGRDRIAGGEGSDRIDAGAGDDYVLEGAGDDRVAGGRGRDYLSYSTWSTGIRVADGRTVTGAGRDTVLGVETIEGTAQRDVMVGGAGDDGLRGLTGEDLVKGGGGDDYLASTAGVIRAGSGNDFVEASGEVTAYLGAGTNGADVTGGSPTVVGGPQQDGFNLKSRSSRATLRGGGGENQVNLQGVRRPVSLDLARGVGSWQGGGLRLEAVHTVVGTNRADLVVGSAVTDIVYGRGGDDVLRGGGGLDLLTGQGGRDRIDGGAAFDYCVAETTVRCEA